MIGFTQAKASFDFIDVGHGKERAMEKIKELTRFHLKNQNCKQILLGISHDAGYAPFLDEVCHVSLVEFLIILFGMDKSGLTYRGKRYVGIYWDLQVIKDEDKGRVCIMEGPATGRE